MTAIKDISKHLVRTVLKSVKRIYRGGRRDRRDKLLEIFLTTKTLSNMITISENKSVTIITYKQEPL